MPNHSAPPTTPKKVMMRASPSEALSIRLLGTMDICRDGYSITSTLPLKGRAVLAYLATTPGIAHSRRKLSEIFWPNLSGEAGRNNLRQVLLIVQRKLIQNERKPIVIANRDSLTFNTHANILLDLSTFMSPLPPCDKQHAPTPTCETCLHDLETMSSAYGGDFLDGLNIDDVPEFDDWLLVQREALRRRAVLLLEQLVECHESQGRNKNALHYALRLCEIDPWNEEAQRRAMLLLATTGQRATAIGHFEALRQSLHHDLGVTPQDETQQLAERIQSGSLRITDSGMPARQSPISSAVERRQVSVVSVGITPQDADMEGALDQLNESINNICNILSLHSGYVVRTHDGALLAYFGYPHPRENAAALAVNAAMDVLKSTLPVLKPRLGAHTGIVLIGDDPQLPDPIGHVSAMAQTLRSSAAPGDVLISGETQKLVAGYFLAEPALPESTHRGAFRVLAPSGAKNRLQAQSNLTQLFGRESEMITLKSVWRDGMISHTRAVVLHGDPGIGKSRLVHTLRHDVVSSSTRVVEFQCNPDYNQSPLRPVIDVLEASFGFHQDDSPERRFKIIAQHLESAAPHTAKEALPLLAELLSLPVLPPYQPSGASPQRQREQIMDLLVTYWLDFVEQGPTLLVIEDLHWIDPTSLELIGRLLENQHKSKYMVIMTARPEFTPPWAENIILSIALQPLSDDEIRAVVLSSNKAFGAEEIDQIVRLADGIPLFAEELLLCVPTLSEHVEEQGHTIPAALRDLLAARLDSLGSAKWIAQTAAAIGRTVELPLLEKVIGLNIQDVKLPLQQLAQAGIIESQLHTTLQFRHALFKDAAYNALARQDREAIHCRIAKAIEDNFSEMALARPELLAQHWTKGGEPEYAIPYWIKAGKLAMRHNAIEEAISHYSSGQNTLQQLPQTQMRTDMEFALYVALGTACYAIEGYASDRGAASFAKALTLMEDTRGNAETFQALWGLWAGHSSHSDWRASLALTSRLGVMASQIPDPLFRQQAAFAAGNTQFWRGEFADAEDHLRQSRALYTPEQNAVHIDIFGENGFVTSTSYLSWTLNISGNQREARKASAAALKEAHRIEHPFSLGYALTFATVLQRMQRRPNQTLARAEETIALAEQYGFPLWLVSGSLLRGWAYVMLGKPQALDEMRQCVNTARTLMGGVSVIFLEILADGLYHAGMIKEARAIIAEALELVEPMDDHHIEAELFRLNGLCHLADQPTENNEAITCFSKALEIAHDQKATLFELRAAIQLANQWQNMGQTEQAQNLLADILKRMPKDDGSPDLKKAHSQMERLNAGQ